LTFSKVIAEIKSVQFLRHSVYVLYIYYIVDVRPLRGWLGIERPNKTAVNKIKEQWCFLMQFHSVCRSRRRMM